MKINKMFFKLVLVIVVATLFGCAKQWYEGEQLREERKCRNLSPNPNETDFQPPNGMESCLERLDKKSYEDYEKERKRTVSE